MAREKNCCQACLNDLEYGVPFHVRDHVMEALQEEEAPSSEVSKEFFWANKRQKQLDDATHRGEHRGTYEKLTDNMDRLKELAALKPGPVIWETRRAPLTAEQQEKLRQRRAQDRRPPPDQSVTTLFVGGVPPVVTKQEVRAEAALLFFFARAGLHPR